MNESEAENTGPARPPETVSERGSAYLLALTMGSEGLPPAAALEELRQRVARLRDPTSPAALEELSGHLPLLDALWQRMAAEAVRAKRPDDRVRLLRAALHAQAAYGRTVALLHGLELQRQDQQLRLHTPAGWAQRFPLSAQLLHEEAEAISKSDWQLLLQLD